MLTQNFAVELVLTLAASLIALSVHEFFHAFAAYKLGDSTAKSMGRLSINPIKHLDPFGVLCMVFFHFGWAKPVPINPNNFEKPRAHFAISALAGPLSNITLGFLSAPIYLLLRNVFTLGENTFLNSLMINTVLFFGLFHIVNVGLGVFNLLPIPPFDGSRIANVLLPEKWYFKIMKYEKKIYLGVLAWMLLGDYVYRALISLSFINGSAFLSGFVRIFSLSGLISDAISFISQIILNFWQLIPFLG